MPGMRTGDQVPDFELPDQTGTPRRLSTLLADGPVVLFFYPAAMTYGCTKESCHFRDLASEFAAADHVVGAEVSEADVAIPGAIVTVTFHQSPAAGCLKMHPQSPSCLRFRAA